MSNEKKVYPKVGRCIYCGVDDVELTDEHIIPLGLGGNWILPKSSCKSCATITGKLEQFCLRPMLGNLRIRLNLPTRRPKDRPTELPIEFIRINGQRETEIVRAHEAPFVCLGYRFPAPGILRGAIPAQDYEDGELIAKFINEGASKYMSPEGQKVKIGTINILEFTRMLAKIAHSYAVAEFGLDVFTPFLPDLILGKSTITPYLVGGDKSDAPLLDSEPALHHVYWQDCLVNGVQYILVAIRLFAIFGMPRYHAVVGKSYKNTP